MSLKEKTDWSKTEKPKIPSHVAIIVDGNRRWSAQKGRPTLEGHRQGVVRIKELIKVAAEKGVRSITFWAFSTENWTRNQKFISDIFSLFRQVLDQRDFFEEMIKSGGQIHILGDISRFPQDIADKINQYLKEPGPQKKIIDVNIALNYGGRDELLRAVRKIVAGGYKPEEVTVELINQFLDTAGQPDVDLMIRTGGELRTSGYLLWQLNYAEFYFTKTYFPDFDKKEFEKALEEYAQRNRRFGGDSTK